MISDSTLCHSSKVLGGQLDLPDADDCAAEAAVSSKCLFLSGVSLMLAV